MSRGEAAKAESAKQRLQLEVDRLKELVGQKQKEMDNIKESFGNLQNQVISGAQSIAGHKSNFKIWSGSFILDYIRELLETIESNKRALEASRSNEKYLSEHVNGQEVEISGLKKQVDRLQEESSTLAEQNRVSHPRNLLLIGNNSN